MLYIDTSVLVAHYCPEDLSLRIQKVLREHAEPAQSHLTEVEFASAVARKVRSDELSSRDGNRILAKFAAHVNTNLFRMISVENHHWRLARGWIELFTTPLRTLHALHLAIASDNALQLVTSDKTFFRAAEMLNIDVRLIAE